MSLLYHNISIPWCHHIHQTPTGFTVIRCVLGYFERSGVGVSESKQPGHYFGVLNIVFFVGPTKNSSLFKLFLGSRDDKFYHNQECGRVVVADLRMILTSMSPGWRLEDFDLEVDVWLQPLQDRTSSQKSLTSDIGIQYSVTVNKITFSYLFFVLLPKIFYT